jgi:hypothetical protein
MMRKLLLSLLFICSVSGCGPTVAEFYRPIPGVTPETVSRLAITCQEPEIYPAQVNDKTDVAMYKKGYLPIGYMQFNGPTGQDSAMLRYAKKIGACVVVINSGYSGTLTGAMSIPQYNPGSTIQVNHAGTINGPRGTTTYSGTSTGQTPGTWSNSYAPYSVARFEYVGVFYVKMKEPSMLGLLVDAAPDKTKKALSIEHGAIVKAVRGNSPAERSGFMSDDIIIKINGIVIDSQETYGNILDNNQQNEVIFTVIRDGKSMDKKVLLGKKPD